MVLRTQNGRMFLVLFRNVKHGQIRKLARACLLIGLRNLSQKQRLALEPRLEQLKMKIVRETPAIRNLMYALCAHGRNSIS